MYISSAPAAAPKDVKSTAAVKSEKNNFQSGLPETLHWIVTDFYTNTALAIEMWNQHIGELLNYHRANE